MCDLLDAWKKIEIVSQTVGDKYWFTIGTIRKKNTKQQQIQVVMCSSLPNIG